MEYIIETNNLCKNYSKQKVLKNLNLHVPKGSIYGLVGKNGAGKTTFMRVLCGIQKQSAGTISLFGVSDTEYNFKRTQRRIGAIIESPSLCPELTARENMMQQYRYLGIPSWDGIDELLEMVDLKDTGDKAVKNFSFGMKQRMGLAMILAGSPDLIVLDEPMNGLDPAGIIDMRELILRLNKERDISFIISSHILDELAKVATHYGFLDEGHLVEELSTEEIESKCRRAQTIDTTCVLQLSKFLEARNYEYTVEGESRIVVYGELELDEIMEDLVASGIKLKSFYQTNETLESYYLSLIGGAKND